jgi:glycosyltransferase involved in cell wall biosynthesis
MTRRLVDTLRQSDRLAAHVDTSDPRPLESLGRFDLENLRLGIVHAAELVAAMRRLPDASVLVPISQGRWGFLRDAVFLLLARALRRRRIVHLHGARFKAFRAQADPFLRLAIRLSLRGAEAWVLTPSLVPVFEELIPPERVRVLENAVEEPVDSEIPRMRGAGNERGVRILFLSGLYREKGAIELLDAASLSHRQGGLDGAEVRIAGGSVSPAVTAEISARAEALREGGLSVSLLGFCDQELRNAEYREADVFVHPTLDDGQPLVLLEAMAVGLPIVATSVGGIPDTIEDERSGILVTPGSVPELAAALERVAGDSALRDRLGDAARARYLERYTPTAFARGLESLLSEEELPGS